LIRQWFGSRVSGLTERFGKSLGRSSLSSLIKGSWIEVLYIFVVVVLSAGIVAALVEPVPIQYIIYPGTDSQSISETVINSMALLMGFGGLYLSYLSGRQTVKPRLVGFYLGLSLVLIALAVYVGIYVYVSK
jgi:predicted PurR-regulated permease PerM